MAQGKQCECNVRCNDDGMGNLTLSPKGNPSLSPTLHELPFKSCLSNVLVAWCGVCGVCMWFCMDGDVDYLRSEFILLTVNCRWDRGRCVGCVCVKMCAIPPPTDCK